MKWPSCVQHHRVRAQSKWPKTRFNLPRPLPSASESRKKLTNSSGGWNSSTASRFSRLGNFCHAMELWMDCIVKNDTDPALIQEVINHGQKYSESLKFMRIDIRKSNLLGRLLYAKEPFRTHMCLIHKGHWNGQAMFLRNVTSCVTGRGGSESARMMVDIPESTSLRRRQKLK